VLLRFVEQLPDDVLASALHKALNDPMPLVSSTPGGELRPRMRMGYFMGLLKQKKKQYETRQAGATPGPCSCPTAHSIRCATKLQSTHTVHTRGTA